MISIELLKRQSLFQDLPDKTLANLQPFVRLQEFEKRAVVLQKGGRGDSLLLLIAGRLQVMSISESGKDVGISFIEQGNHFGEISLIDGGSRSASVVSVINSTVGFLPRTNALELFHNEPSVAARIQKRLCAVIRNEIQLRASLVGRRAHARVCSVLVNDPRFIQSATSNAPTMLSELPNQSMIASMANVSRETVSRVLSELSKNGIIRRGQGYLEVLKPESLRQLACDQPIASEK
jgi:CRP/FNR family cyclic AMP-dependent transcriptional regulator